MPSPNHFLTLSFSLKLPLAVPPPHTEKMQTHPQLNQTQHPRFQAQSLISIKKPSTIVTPTFRISFTSPKSPFFKARSRGIVLTACISHGAVSGNVGNIASVSSLQQEEEEGEEEEEEEEEEPPMEVNRQGLENENLWKQMKEIVAFTGPAVGLWLCGPLMSLIDTAVIGQGSSIELAALGPGTVWCDNMGYVFMFLSVATSNMVATSLAKQDKNEVQYQLSILLFIGLTCGFVMLFFTKFFGLSALSAFIGSGNSQIVPAANTYIQIRGLAWPAMLIGWVAQSASLGMKDSWGPLKALAVSSAINGIGDILLCRLLGYGIAGAAWATMVSQLVAGYMMIDSLNKKGYKAYALSVPSLHDLKTIFGIAAPVFVMMMSKVAFYALLVYFATSMGTLTLAAHQVMIQAFFMFAVWGEPLCQTAQSFLPEFFYGINRNLTKARMLLKSLAIIGTFFGLVLGIIGASIPLFFPNIFTPDQKVIQEMHKVLVQHFMALAVTPCILSLEGALLAGRDLIFASLSMTGCFSLSALYLMLVRDRGYGLSVCWYALVGFQWARFSLALQRLLSPKSILFSEDLSQNELKKLKTA